MQGVVLQNTDTVIFHTSVVVVVKLNTFVVKRRPNSLAVLPITDDVDFTEIFFNDGKFLEREGFTVLKFELRHFLSLPLLLVVYERTCRTPHIEGGKVQYRELDTLHPVQDRW